MYIVLIKYTGTGKIVGGKLKTTAEADKESLQAGWFTSDVNKLPEEIPLRYNYFNTYYILLNQAPGFLELLCP